jgi:ABC-2 type transport system ATP-binding protein
MRIEFDQVTKCYFTKRTVVKAVSELSWQIEAGGVYGVIGPNGSGKTSMIRMLLDLIRPDQGRILIDGAPDGNRSRGFKKALGYLPEERGLYRDGKALEVLGYLAELKGVPRAEAKREALALIGELGLEGSVNKPLKSYSKGMCQKIQIIAALQHKPALVVLDEPFAGLDPLNVSLVRDLVERRRAEGSVVILCTHMMDEAERLCDYILMMNRGRLVRWGPQRKLREEFGRVRILVRADEELQGFETVAGASAAGGMKRVHLQPQASAADFLKEAAGKLPHIREIEISPASLEEIYIQLVQQDD